MYFSTVIASSALLALAAARPGLSQDARLASRQSGTVDPGTISDCTFFTDYPSKDFPDQGSTCAAIASYWGITAQQFVTYNPVVGSVSNCKLQSGHSYCVEENNGNGPKTTSTPTTTKPTGTPAPSPTQSGLTKDCNRFYKVVGGDTCQGIVDKYGTFSLGQFYSWNPAVNDNCSGLQADVYVCVGVPGTPTKATTTSTPKPTSSGPQPEQTGITSDCKAYYKVVSGDTCQGIVDKYGTFTLNQFYSWNPALGSNCEHLFLDYYVCVGVSGTPTTHHTTTTTPTTTGKAGPSPTQSGIVSNCQRYYQAVSGDSCDVIANQKFGTFSVAQFESWNPAVGSDCSKLFLGYYYCVGVPGTPTSRTSTTTPSPTPTTHGPQPQQPGVVSNCRSYYKVASGDSCYTIEQSRGISANQFFSWNKGIKTDCSNLYSGYYVCVGV